MKETVLVLAAHPDDEVLGCGAAIAKHVQAGDEVHVVIMAEGVTSRDTRRDREKISPKLDDLAKQAREASAILGVSRLTLHDFPDNRMDSLDLLDIVKVVEGFVSDIAPSRIYTHHAWDVNVDHCRIHQAVVTACRPIPGQAVKTLLFFEVASSTEWQPPMSGFSFSPNWYVDVSHTLENKLAALKAYHAEMRDWPHARSVRAVESLARWRGASIGVEAAEAFMLGRAIV